MHGTNTTHGCTHVYIYVYTQARLTKLYKAEDVASAGRALCSAISEIAESLRFLDAMRLEEAHLRLHFDALLPASDKYYTGMFFQVCCINKACLSVCVYLCVCV